MWTIDAISTRFRHGGHATTLINYVPLANGGREGYRFVCSKRFEIFIRRFGATRLRESLSMLEGWKVYPFPFYSYVTARNKELFSL